MIKRTERYSRIKDFRHIREYYLSGELLNGYWITNLTIQRIDSQYEVSYNMTLK